jgi:hypothetical protein
MSNSKPVFLLAVMIVAFVLLPRAYASSVSLTISPTTQTVPQTSTASYSISLSSGSKAAYQLSLSGLGSRASYSFSANPVSTPAGSGTSSLTIDTSSPPLFCPGIYSFAVSASNSTSAPTPGNPGDSGSASASLMVVQVGPPLAVTVSTDKSTYRTGDVATIMLTATRPAEGRMVISSPSGSPATFLYTFLGPTYSLTKTLTVTAIGQWTVNFQADDFCSGYSSASASFDVTPDTYDASITLNGVPAQYSSQVTVDNQAGGTIGGSEIRKLSFEVDTTHTVVVDQYVQGDPGVRYFAAQNTWSVSAADSHTFEYEPQYLLTVVTDPDGIAQVTGGGWYSAGTSVQTNQVPATVPGPSGTQYAFKGWEIDGSAQSGNWTSVTMDKPHKVVAAYETQYLLSVDSPYGDPHGQGYYAAGSTASFSVTTPYGFPVQQIFVRWEGDYTGTSPQGSITMDKPKLIHAVWSVSYIPLIAVVLVAIAVVAALLTWRRRKQPEPETKPPQEADKEATASGTVKCSSCGTENSSDQKFCTNCGQKLANQQEHT